MTGFTHQIDPIVGQVGGLYLWWYGLSYTSGFLSLHLWLRRSRERLALSLAQVYSLTLAIMAGVLLGGRLVEVFVYEWPFYREHLQLIPAVWLGGMATHGLLLGGVLAAGWYCRAAGRPFLPLLDELTIPATLIMGLGRIGNLIDGQIVGSVTTAWWGVKFPDAEGFRHPVVLYDGLKNLLLIPVLLWVRRSRPRTGVLAALFLFGYAFLRIFVDVFREYPTTLLGLATGQSLNIAMSVAAIILFIQQYRRGAAMSAPTMPVEAPVSLWRPVVFAIVLVGCAVMPSDWTQDVPARYGARHPGLEFSQWYRPIGGAQ